MPRAKAAPLAERDTNAGTNKSPKGKSDIKKNKDIVVDTDQSTKKRPREESNADATASKSKKAKSDSTGSKSKKADKDKDADKYDVSSISLDGQEDGSVPVFDTCDDLRTKIRAYIRSDGNTQASLARHMNASQSTNNVTGTQIKSFLDKKGPASGATSGTYYAGYVFFEKMRLKQNKPKSKKRQEMEEQYPAEGMDRGRDGNNARYFSFGDERPAMDKYGKIHMVPKGAFR